MFNLRPNEGDDVARCLASDLKSYKVWFDSDRQRLSSNQLAISLINCDVVIAIVTSSFHSNNSIKQEIQLAEKHGKRIVYVKEVDPVYYGGRSIVNGDIYLQLKRFGNPKRIFINKLFESIGLGFNDSIKSNTITITTTSLLTFTGDEEESLDLYYNLSNSLYSIGVSSCYSINNINTSTLIN